MFTQTEYARHVTARLFDFFTVNAQWQRRLWNVGLPHALYELDEAIEGQHARALSSEAIRWLADSVKARLADDPGIGPQDRRKSLTRLLEGDLTYGGMSHRVLRQYADDTEKNYLPRWEATLRDPNVANPSRERTARAIGARLLDSGFSQQALRDWLRRLASDGGRTLDIADIVAEAQALVEQPRSTYEVLVLFPRTPPGVSPSPEGWARTRQVKQWLAANGIDESELPDNAHGGVVMAIESLDEYSAVSEAGGRADRLAARVAVGTRRTFTALPSAFVAGVARAVPLRRPRRVDILSLDRQRRLYDDSGLPSIESAFELVSHFDYGQGPVAVAGGWSAVEFLLTAPGDKANVSAADRLASLVACSWPRAELTTIAKNRIASNRDSLSTELAALPTNRARCERLVEEIEAGREISNLADSDLAAVHRMERLLRNPAKVLADVRGYATESLRRLYRQRNLVLHGGRTRGVALDSTLRTAAPLVGAGVDRIVHAHLTTGLDPLQVAARAEFEMQRAGLPGATDVTALLE